ncbi:hypothetical protein D3C78_1473970 [compost metagenome]
MDIDAEGVPFFNSHMVNDIRHKFPDVDRITGIIRQQPLNTRQNILRIVLLFRFRICNIGCSSRHGEGIFRLKRGVML